ncbi:hypothetical protein DEJ25_13470 [Curtobacterium sp. MCPF17_011]|nr:hypothetical protein DEJ25_13470 [Curtobacterium sp. MCPF17_011]
MALFAEHGFSATTIPMIASASGVSRTSVFRYWGSKSDIVWAEFDEHIAALAQLLTDRTDTADATMDIVRRSVVENLDRSIHASSLWRERFTLIDSSDELRSEEARRWLAWASVIADFVAHRHAIDPADPVPQSVGGAVQGAFVAVLRAQLSGPRTDTVLSALDHVLNDVGSLIQGWLYTKTALGTNTPH